jgi:hypothetical protein
VRRALPKRTGIARQPVVRRSNGLGPDEPSRPPNRLRFGVASEYLKLLFWSDLLSAVGIRWNASPAIHLVVSTASLPADLVPRQAGRRSGEIASGSPSVQVYRSS